MILSGELSAGEQLPSHVELARQLGVSRTALRESFKVLESLGFIECIHGRGTFVCSTYVSLTDILEARRSLENATASMAAARASEMEVTQLKALVAAMESNVQKRRCDAFSEQDLEFHLMIGKMSGNRVLARLLVNVSDLVLNQQSETQRLPGAMERAHRYHAQIAEAIAAHNPAAAARLIGEHLDDVTTATLGGPVALAGGNRT
jgi:GntR family transcriptional repressor for pyruvate dehydrogenase complex